MSIVEAQFISLSETMPEQQQKSSAAPTKKRVFSGVQPTGNIHLGNYLGAIRNWVGSQANYDNIFCIVDLHAITLPIDPKELHINTRKLAALYLACGLDTRYCKLFVQSHVHEHAEMSWILNCFTPMGWLNRMTQFKSKAGDDMEFGRRRTLLLPCPDGLRHPALSNSLCPCRR